MLTRDADNVISSSENKSQNNPALKRQLDAYKNAGEEFRKIGKLGGSAAAANYAMQGNRLGAATGVNDQVASLRNARPGMSISNPGLNVGPQTVDPNIGANKVVARFDGGFAGAGPGRRSDIALAQIGESEGAGKVSAPTISPYEQRLLNREKRMNFNRVQGNRLFNEDERDLLNERIGESVSLRDLRQTTRGILRDGSFQAAGRRKLSSGNLPYRYRSGNKYSRPSFADNPEAYDDEEY